LIPAYFSATLSISIISCEKSVPSDPETSPSMIENEVPDIFAELPLAFGIKPNKLKRKELQLSL